MLDLDTLDLDTLDFAKGGGLVTVVVQDAVTGDVLMVAHADREALERTVATGEMHYRSRSRGLWHKGATSGNTQRVVALVADCDRDAVLARVSPAGPACHTGALSCFGEAGAVGDELSALDATIARRTGSTGATLSTASTGLTGLTGSTETTGTTEMTGTTAGERPSYTARLLADRNLRLKKIGEEGAELVTACADGDAARAVEEAADIVYHVLVALRAVGASLGDVRAVLARRAGR